MTPGILARSSEGEGLVTCHKLCLSRRESGRGYPSLELVQIARQSPPDCRRHSFLNSGMRRCIVWAWGTSIIGSLEAIGSMDDIVQHDTVLKLWYRVAVEPGPESG